MKLILFLIIILVIVAIIAIILNSPGPTIPNTTSSSKLIYSYGLFSDKPMNKMMLKTVQENFEKTGLDFEILGYEEVKADMAELDIPDLPDLYEKIPRGVSKADLARMIHIYARGGHYTDLDVLFEEKPVMSETHVVLYTENLDPFRRTANYAFSAPPKHPFIKAAIEEIAENIRRAPEKWTDDDVLRITGPGALTKIYRSRKWDDVVLIGLIRSRRILKHQAEGSWRDGKDL